MINNISSKMPGFRGCNRAACEGADPEYISSGEAVKYSEIIPISGRDNSSIIIEGATTMADAALSSATKSAADAALSAATKSAPAATSGTPDPLSTPPPAPTAALPAVTTTVLDPTNNFMIDCVPDTASAEEILTYNVPVGSEYDRTRSMNDFMKTTTDYYLFTIGTMFVYFVLPPLYKKLIINMALNGSGNDSTKASKNLRLYDFLIFSVVVIIAYSCLTSGVDTAKSWGIFIIVTYVLSVALISNKREIKAGAFTDIEYMTMPNPTDAAVALGFDPKDKFEFSELFVGPMTFLAYLSKLENWKNEVGPFLVIDIVLTLILFLILYFGRYYKTIRKQDSLSAAEKAKQTKAEKLQVENDRKEFNTIFGVGGGLIMPIISLFIMRMLL